MSDNLFNRSGIYGSPLSSGLNDMRLPKNPEMSTPETVKRAGGAIEPRSSGNENGDLLPPKFP